MDEVDRQGIEHRLADYYNRQAQPWLSSGDNQREVRPEIESQLARFDVHIHSTGVGLSG